MASALKVLRDGEIIFLLKGRQHTIFKLSPDDCKPVPDIIALGIGRLENAQYL